jgi:hypothetical protein
MRVVVRLNGAETILERTKALGDGGRLVSAVLERVRRAVYRRLNTQARFPVKVTWLRPVSRFSW